MATTASQSSVYVRTTHRYGFRSGQWAELLSTVPAPDKSDCYLVRFPDGVTDWWVVNDPDGQYEFRHGSDPGDPVATEKDSR